MVSIKWGAKKEADQKDLRPIDYGSETDRNTTGCGPDVDRMWTGCGPEVARDGSVIDFRIRPSYRTIENF